MIDGKIFYDRHGNKKVEHRGEFQNNVLNGQGEIIVYYRNGSRLREWKGTFRNGKLQDGEIIQYGRDGRVNDRRDARSFFDSLHRRR